MSKEPTRYLPDPSEIELSRWVKQLQEAESHLRETLGDKFDAVLGSGGQTFLLQQAQEKLRKSEAEARRNEAMLRDAQRIARFGGWELEITNPDSIDSGPLRWSEEVFRIFGYEPGGIEVSNENFFRAVHPEDREPIKGAVATAIREGRNYEIDHRIILPNGTVRYVHEEAHVFKDPVSGQPIKLVGIVQDITERQQKEESLRVSEERFASAFEHASIGMALVSPEGRFLKVNCALCTLTGYTTDELVHLTFQDITHPDDLRADLACVHRMLTKELSHYQMEKRYLHKQGHIVWVLLSVSLVWDHQGAPLYFISQIQDITERKENELRLKRLNRLYSVLSKINEAIVRTGDEEELCETVCQIAVEQGQLRMAWVGEVDPQTKDVVPFASAGADDGYLTSISVSAQEGEMGNGPVGCAIRENRPNVCHDVTSDPRMEPWREAARQRGYSSLAAFPLPLGDERQGVMVFYAAEPYFFSQEDLDLLLSTSENIAFALDSIRKEQLRLDAAEALRRSEEHYRLLFVDNPHPMWVYDVATLKFLAVNTAAQVQYGYTEDEYLKMTIRDIRPVDELPRFDEQLRSLPLGKNQIGARHHKKNGEIIEVDICSDSIIFDGRDARLVAATNVTERKVFEQRLAEQAALIDEARDAIIVRDMEHRILFWNKGAERLYGWTVSEAVNQLSTGLFYGNLQKFTPSMESLLEKGAWIGELEHVTKTGTVVTVESRWTLLRDDAGLPKAVLCINTDITERKKMEAHFLRAQRMESIGTLAGGIAHDLNNLLAPIIMGVDLLRHFGVEGPVGKIVDDIERSAKRGSSLVKQVLSFARGVEGSRAVLPVKDIMDELESIIRNTFPKDIILEMKLPGAPLFIKGDPTQLNQVLLNLCVNSRDAMPRGGLITLSVEATMIDAQYDSNRQGVTPGRYVCIDVTDTGCGIPPENIHKIFDPFFTTKELAKGTGLGLATALGIVRSHGGFLNVYSEVDRGTNFKIYLPALDESAKAQTAEAESEDWPRGNGEWILLVDDETSILTITQQTLEAFGYRVLTAENGAQAIGLFAANRERIALVLTDMMMPVMDGAATILALREIDPHIKIVAASGLNANSDVARDANAGVKHLLAKPYTTGTMLSTLKAALTEEP